MASMKLLRLNRWALSALVERDARSQSELCRDLEIAPSTLTGLLKGRRDASYELVELLASPSGLDVPVEALLSDPHRQVPVLVAVAEAAERGTATDLHHALIELRRTLR